MVHLPPWLTAEAQFSVYRLAYHNQSFEAFVDLKCDFTPFMVTSNSQTGTPVVGVGLHDPTKQAANRTSHPFVHFILSGFKRIEKYSKSKFQERTRNPVSAPLLRFGVHRVHVDGVRKADAGKEYEENGPAVGIQRGARRRPKEPKSRQQEPGSGVKGQGL